MLMGNIIALSGKKQSGKNTSFNYLVGVKMLQLAVVRDKVGVGPDGKLRISDLFGDHDYEGLFDPERDNPEMIDFLSQHVWPWIKNYSYAVALKQEVCMNLLGLTHDQCFGNDADKNSLTKLKWENMPGAITQEEPPSDAKQVSGRLGKYYKKCKKQLVYHAPGFMTAREVLQYVGTDIFRKMYDQVWAQRTIDKIKAEDSLLAVITDCRFPNEVEAVHKNGGKVIRFTRCVNAGSDPHPSETALDKDKYDWKKFDAVIDNMDMTITEQNNEVNIILDKWGYFDKVETSPLVEKENDGDTQPQRAE